uniref:Ubiquitin-like protease family profile domain-containing protein n=3 Tax=Brassica TaxID=3705 RepID=A0A0D2ZXP5_BRAOL
MEILMYTVGKHHKDMLAGVSSIFVSPWLTSYIQKKHWQFERAKHKDRFPTDFRLSSLVLLPGQKSITNVHTIYAPMIWADRHWVGLAINLPRRLVEVLDPLPELNNDRKVKRFLDPVLKMLPFVINKIAFPPLSQFTGDSPFTWSRKHALTKNSHTGDCGPVSIKFIEMHALGDPAPHMS